MNVRAFTARWTYRRPHRRRRVSDAEKVIGYPLPRLLRRLYLEVANGGFGPDFGVLGVAGGE